jgi:hypothetical protein
MIKVLILILVLQSAIGLAQSNESFSEQNGANVEARFLSNPTFEKNDTILGIRYNANKWLTLGANHDVINSVFGITISNGYDEHPIVHFEDLTADFLYKISGQTNLEKDYTFGANIAWNYPNRYLNLISVEYTQRNISSVNLFYRDISLSAKRYLRVKNLSTKVKIGHQNLKDKNNLGAQNRT